MIGPARDGASPEQIASGPLQSGNPWLLDRRVAAWIALLAGLLAVACAGTTGGAGVGAAPATEAAAETAADLVVVAADPLANPEFLERVDLVVEAGVVVWEFGN